MELHSLNFKGLQRSTRKWEKAKKGAVEPRDHGRRRQCCSPSPRCPFLPHQQHCVGEGQQRGAETRLVSSRDLLPGTIGSAETLIHKAWEGKHQLKLHKNVPVPQGSRCPYHNPVTHHCKKLQNYEIAGSQITRPWVKEKG